MTNLFLNDLHNYWQSKCGKELLPKRNQIDPIDMAKFLPYLILLDVEDDPLDFRYRLVGTGICSYLRKDYTGIKMSEIQHQSSGNKVWSSCEKVVVGKCVVRSEDLYVCPKKDLIHSYSIMLPLTSDGERVDMILAGVEIDHFVSSGDLMKKYLSSLNSS